MAHVIWHYQDTHGAPLAGVALHATNTPHGDWNGTTDGNGNFDSNLLPGLYLVTATKAGYQTDVLPATIEFDGTIARELKAAGVVVPGVLPSLIRSGRDFVTPEGQREVLIGADAFLAYRQFLNGADLTPFFAETKELGFNMWRVFFQGSIAQNTVLQLSPTEPGYYDKVRPFAELLNRQGLVLLGVIGVDNQDIQSPPEHWTRMYDRLEGTRAIVSKANEWGKNIQPLNPSQLPNPTGNLLWSQGSGLQDEAPFKPTGPVMEFHPVRHYTTAMRDAVASPIELYEVQNYGNVQLLFDEPGRMGSQRPSPAEFAQPKHCYEYARIASTLCAGVVFHNWPGQSGQLMDPGTKDCARAFVSGIHA